MRFNIHRLKIDNDITRVSQLLARDSKLSQIYRYLMCYMGEPGYTEIFKNVSVGDGKYNKAISDFVTDSDIYNSSFVNALVFENTETSDVTNIFFVSASNILTWENGKIPESESKNECAAPSLDIETDTDTKTYRFDFNEHDSILIDIVSSKGYGIREAWIYLADSGVKNFMFGVAYSDMNEDEFLEMVKSNLINGNYIENYIDEYGY